MKNTDCWFADKPVRFGRSKGHVLDCVQQEEKFRDGRNKMLVLQKIEFVASNPEKRLRFRVGYYMKNGDKWVWARNTPIFRKEDLQALIEKAKGKGWI